MKNTLLMIMSTLTLSACSEVGSKAWCEDMRENQKRVEYSRHARLRQTLHFQQ